ncbi:FMN-binding protein [Angustibacter sp. Root456]|uniref:FMN-binding protein n=1 Tax=Angustibacter sp. Root456 TaxID=1736539 RepID=UPI0006FB6597|nr:FMN-binding protein [Angustibacter sp. Root456]KQX62720.1 hypothetical protein ASD06_11785 [Angustibacter sp. Root456]
MRRRTAAATVITAAAALVTAWRVGGTAGQPGSVPGVHVVAAPPSASSTHQPASRSKTGSRSTTRTTAPATKRTITGAVVSTPYGDVQVAAVVKGSKLLDVKALHLTDANGTSRSISANAAPQLRSEALQAQSAQIDTVSGATYTSEGYRQSLQAALDAAHL